MDQTYRNLLLHLQTSKNELHKGIPPTLARYLNTLPLPLPTNLTASAIASPAWIPSNVNLILLAFRHAVHQKVDTLVAPASTNESGAGPSTTGSSLSIFSLSPGPAWNLRKWVRALCAGARHGQSFVRAAALGGLLLGLEDVKERLDAGGARWRVEDEVVVAFAEYLEGLDDSWVTDARGREGRTDKEDILHIASNVLPVVSENKFRVLDLSNIIGQCMGIIQATFTDARFLQSQLMKVDELYSDTINTRLPRLARLTSRSIDVLSDNPTSQKLDLLHQTLQETVGIVEGIVTKTESSWAERELSSSNETESNKMAWVHLKSLLFTAVMILQSVTDSVLYNAFPTNPSLASHVLEIFSHLSFVSTKFGGVVARGETAFREYQRAFYTSLDIVAAFPPHGEELVTRLAMQLGEPLDVRVENGLVLQPGLNQVGQFNQPNQQAASIRLARTAYYLAVAEQLVDQLSAEVLLDSVLPICKRYLDKPQEREVFESSHSVVLALFASLGKQKAGDQAINSKRHETLRAIIPFYTSSLISCSADGMLNTTQLRLAFSSLVAGASANLLGSNDHDTTSTALVWYCIECVISEITSKYQHDRKQGLSEEQYDRLVLTLVSLIASIPPTPSLASILPRLLREVERIVKLEEDAQRREIVVKAIYEEILRSVGDQTREVVLRWWFDVLGQNREVGAVDVGGA